MENELILFETADKEIKLTVPIENNTVWLNRKQLAELFGRLHRKESKSKDLL